MDFVFTIVSRNYAAQAACLMQSLAAAEPDLRRIVVATDGPIAFADPGVRVVEAASLAPGFAEMSAYYDALELNTAVKPHAFKALLAEPGARAGAYLDPDIWVYRPLAEVRAALERAPLALTPHITRPLPGEANPNDRVILASGVYNLGFMGARAEPQIMALLDWWGEKCRLDCRVDFEGGLFTDQRWMDLAPGFVSDLAILRSPGLNLAYWNLDGRDVAIGSGGWTVDGEPLGFFHFSGFDPARPDLVSKHQDRVQAPAGSPLARLLAEYARALLAQGHAEAARIPYGHGAFPSGRAASGPMRRRMLRAAKAGEDFGGGLTETASAWLDAADPETAAAGLPDLTRLMAQIGREAGLDLSSLEQRLAFHGRFRADAAGEAAGRRLLETWRAGARASDGSAEEAPWRAGSAAVLAWLTSTETGDKPRAIACVASGRQDLRLRFADDEAGLLAWLLGPESAAGGFDARLLPDATLARLAADPALLLQAARFAAPDRRGLGLRLFAAYGLAHRARWPAGLIGALRGDFDEPAPGLPGPFPRVFLAIWESRGDLQRLFPLARPVERFRYLRWLAGGGLAEYGVDVEALPAWTRRHPAFLLAAATIRRRVRPPAPPPAARGRSRLLEVVETAEGEASGAAMRFEAGRGLFRRADGAPADPPALVDELDMRGARGLAGADIVALLARGVRWTSGRASWDAA